jgi:hypothetical protein
MASGTLGDECLNSEAAPAARRSVTCVGNTPRGERGTEALEHRAGSTQIQRRCVGVASR